eukprot:1402195-Pleurochrysis_carterae.AAC.1
MTPPRTLPLEFRPANQRRLDEFERLYRELEAEEASSAAAGPSGTADEDVEAVTNAPDAAAEIAVAALGAADESAGAATAALDVAVETT